MNPHWINTEKKQTETEVHLVNLFWIDHA